MPLTEAPQRFHRSLRYFRQQEASLLWTPDTGLIDLMGRTAASTFGRASAKSFQQNGKLFSAASGAFDPTGRIDPAYTNNCIQSQTLDNAAWAKTRLNATPVVANDIAAPDGSVTADRIVEDGTAANTHFIASTSLTGGITTGLPYTLSVYAKAKERSWIQLRVGAYPAAGACVASFNLGAGTVGTISGNGTSKTARMEALANGWYRCCMSFVSHVTTAITADIHLATADATVAYNGDNASGLYLWGAQFESGLTCRPYVPTTTIAVTTAADSLTFPVGLPLANSGSARTYSFFVQQKYANTSYPIDTALFLHTHDVGGTAESIRVYRSTSGLMRVLLTDAGATVFDSGAIAGTALAVGRHKITLSIQSGNSWLAINGVKVYSSAATFAFSGTTNTIRIGSTGTAAQEWGAQILGATVLPRNLPTSELPVIERILTEVAGYAA